MDYFIVGLGNPGKKYVWSRHNVAWNVLDTIFGTLWERDSYLEAWYQQEMIANTHLHLILPQTFMNNSGKTVSTLQKIYSSFTTERCIVIHDDIDLPLGTVRIAFDRGSGGHNGVRSIHEHLGTSSFLRIRIGIAKELGDGRIVKPAVLGTFSFEERDYITKNIAPLVHSMLTKIVEQGYQAAMNSYH